MKIRALGILLALSAAATTPAAQAADWFDRVSEKLGTIEQNSSGQILMWVNNGGIAINVPGRTSTCSMTSVLLTPPTGKEKEWLAMVLASTLSGTPFTVYGNCNSSTQQIEASRLQIVYQGL